MRKTKTKTKRKTSSTTRKRRGGATSSRIQYRIRTTNHAGISNETNLSHHAYDTITQRIDGTLDTVAIYDYVREHPELQGGLDTTLRPLGTNHIVNRERTIHTIVATYPRYLRVHRSSSPPLRADSRYTARPTILRRRSSSRSRSPNLASDSEAED